MALTTLRTPLDGQQNCSGSPRQQARILLLHLLKDALVRFLKKFDRLRNRGEAVAHTVARLDRHIEDIKINQGRALSKINSNQTSSCLRDYEFKVFSQWGEDGIIQKLVEAVPIANKTFIEFGVEDFRESNCRFLMMKDNWSGFVVDGSEHNIQTIRNSYYYWKYNLTAIQGFINSENVCGILSKSRFDSDIGILSIDIDGMDYHVLRAINIFSPRILICEYNSLFGSTRAVTVPYDPSFMRAKAHPSHLYFGASISAWNYLAKQRGYTMVGSTSEGVNVFFVRNDLMNDALVSISSTEAYVASKFREGRTAEGSMSFANFEDRRAQIAGLPVLDVITGKVEPFECT